MNEEYRILDVSENISFEKNIDAINWCTEMNYKGKSWYQACWPSNHPTSTNYRIWFPKLCDKKNGKYIPTSNGFINYLSEDWEYFTFDDVSGKQNSNPHRISNEDFLLNYIVDFTERQFAQDLIQQINGEMPQTSIISEERIKQVAGNLGVDSGDLFAELLSKKYIDWQRHIIPENKAAFFSEYMQFSTGLAEGKIKDRNREPSNTIKIRRSAYNEILMKTQLVHFVLSSIIGKSQNCRAVFIM